MYRYFLCVGSASILVLMVGCGDSTPSPAFNGAAGSPPSAAAGSGGTSGAAAGSSAAGSGGTGGAAAGSGGMTGGAAGSGGTTGGAAGSGGTSGAAGLGGTSGAAGSGGLAGSGGSGGSGGASGAAGTGGGSGFPPDCSNAPVAKWADIYKAVVSPGCGNYCHNGGTSNNFGGGLDLYPTDQARAWRNLVMQDPKQGYVCYQKGKRVVPGSPETSIVYSKLINKPICGKAEPQGTPAGMLTAWMPLTNDQICMFYTWIKAGALDN